jgi:hypothetical protein
MWERRRKSLRIKPLPTVLIYNTEEGMHVCMVNASLLPDNRREYITLLFFDQVELTEQSATPSRKLI